MRRQELPHLSSTRKYPANSLGSGLKRSQPSNLEESVEFGDPLATEQLEDIDASGKESKVWVSSLNNRVTRGEGQASGVT
jgi:hypothetical protein